MGSESCKEGVFHIVHTFMSVPSQFTMIMGEQYSAMNLASTSPAPISLTKKCYYSSVTYPMNQKVYFTQDNLVFHCKLYTHKVIWCFQESVYFLS